MNYNYIFTITIFFTSYISKIVFSCFLSIIFFFLASCSLKYSETVNSEDTVPEFVFEDTNLVRYENNRPTLELSAGSLEQYKNTDETYGKDVNFKAYNDAGEVETEGSCGIIFADSEKKTYELYDDINLYNVPENVRFYANMLKWNGNTEQLISGRSDMVKIEKDDTIMRGNGFTASGISKTFSFRGNITGTIETSDDEKNEDNGWECCCCLCFICIYRSKFNLSNNTFISYGRTYR